MKITQHLLFFCILSIIAAKQNFLQAQPTFNYALSLAPNADNMFTTGYSIAKDGQGNIYVSGAFNGTVNFNPSGSASLTAIGTTDAFVVKYNSSGVYQWAFNYGYSGKQTTAVKIASDLVGNIYVIGFTNSTTAFDVDPSSNTNNLTLTGSSTSNYIIKFDGTKTPSSTSFYLWNFCLGRCSNSASPIYRNFGIALDNAGYLYVSGAIVDENFDFDPSSNTHTLGSGFFGYFVAKYNANLTPSSTSFYQWAKTTSSDVGGNGQVWYGSRGIAVDGSGNVYTVGGFFANDGSNATPPGLTGNTGYVDFSNGTAGTTYQFGTPTNATSNLSMPDGYVVKYNSNGTFQWAFTLSSWDFDWVNDIAADASGNIYITGMFGDYDGAVPNSYTSTLDFDPSSSTHNLTTNGYGAVFVAKYNANYTPSSTSFYQWALKVTGSTSTLATQGNSISLDPSGNVYVSGQFMNSSINFDPSGTHTLSAGGSTDAFVARYTNSGAYSYAYALGGSGADISYGINVDISGNVLTTGVFASSNVNFNPSGSNTISAGTGRSIFVAGYTQCDNSFYRWTGGTSTAWSTASNWCGAAVPTSTGVAVIPSGTSNSPSLSSSQSLVNLVVKSGASLNVTSTLTLSGNLYNLGITATTNTLQTAYDVYNPGTISGSGSLQLNGSVSQNIVGTGTINNLTINNSNGVNIAVSNTVQSVTGTITPTSGTLTTNGNLVLTSSGSGSASIAQGSGSYLSGNVTVQRYIGSSAQWRMIGFPFTQATTIAQSTLAGFYTSGYNAYTYNEGADDQTHYGNNGTVNAGWTQFTSGTTSAKNGILLIGGTPGSIINFTGPINTGTQTIALTKAKNGWNLIANPFPSNLNWTSIYTPNSANIAATVYRYDPNTTAYGSYNANTVSQIGNQGNVLENGSAFFVQATSASNLSITESDKTTSAVTASMMNIQNRGTIATNGIGDNTMGNNKSIIKLALLKQGDKYADEVIVRWGGGFAATDSFDLQFDGYDLGRATGPDLSVIGNDKTVYSIFHGAALKNSDEENRKVQLGIKQLEEGTYEIGINLLSGIANGNNAYLYDSYRNEYTLIDGNTKVYTFLVTSDAQSQSFTRFSVVINPKLTTNSSVDLPIILLNNPTNTGSFTLFSRHSYNQLQWQLVDGVGKTIANGIFKNVVKGSSDKVNGGNIPAGSFYFKLTGDGTALPVLKAIKN